MKRRFQITRTFTVLLDDWLVIFYDNKGAQIAQWNTESWSEWGMAGILPSELLEPEYIEAHKNDVVNRAIELYVKLL